MKYIVFLVLSAAILIGCHTPGNMAHTGKKAIIAKSQDSTEYEVVVFDTEFDTWYLINFNRVLDMSNDYYRSMNNLAVSRWNSYYTSGRYSRVVENYLDYDYNIDYGIEVNRKLYWYFKFVQEHDHLRLLK
jgi:hypothetical protein